MAVLRVAEIEKMPAAERTAKTTELRKELMKLNSQRSTGANIESPGKIRAIKRAIARMLTIEKKMTGVKIN